MQLSDMKLWQAQAWHKHCIDNSPRALLHYRTCRQPGAAVQGVRIVLQPLARAPLQRPLRQPKWRAVKGNYPAAGGAKSRTRFSYAG